ncbi:hypothetical protein LCM19_13625 [Qipengyuania flava]|nr:hypothetical protein [Qipengyuania flava]
MAFTTPLSAEEEDDKPALSEAAQKLQNELDIQERELKLLQSENSLLREKYKVPSLGGVSNETTFSGEGAGKLELGMLDGDVLFAMVDALSARFQNQSRDIILLSGSESLPLADAGLVRQEVDERHDLLRRKMLAYEANPLLEIGQQPIFNTGRLKSVINGATVAAELVKAIGEAVSIQTTVAAALFTSSDTQLTRLMIKHDRVRRPDAQWTVPEDHPLRKAFGEMRQTIAAAQGLPEPAKGSPKKGKWDELQVQLALAKDLEKRLLTPTEGGILPLYTAARYETLMDGKPLIATIWSDFSAGTFITRNTLKTKFLGYDGSNMAAGTAASYTIVDPETGNALETGIIRCISDYTTMTDVMRLNIGAQDNQKLVAAECRTRYR